MKFISIAIVVTLSITSSQGQGGPGKHEGAVSPMPMRITALQNQINKQQIEINGLRARIAKLQSAFQELADTIADESADTDEDDFSDDSDVTGFVVNSPSIRPKRCAEQIRRSSIAVFTNRPMFRNGCGASLEKSKLK